MKHKHIFHLLCALIFIVTSCDKLPQNGVLDGSWQLVKMTRKDTLPSPNKIPATPPLIENGSEMQNYGIYWNIQLDMLMIYTPYVNHNGHTGYTAARFYTKHNQFNITDTYIHFDNRDSLLTPSTRCLQNVGIIGNQESFDMRLTGNNRMTLISNLYILEFRKF